MVPRRMASLPVFHHSAGTFSALRKKAKHQPAIINTINHAKCSVVPGIVPWIWKKMMNKNDVRELVFTSSKLQTHGKRLFSVFTKLNMEHMRISRVCVAHSTMLHLCSNVCSTPYLCACVCVCACVCMSIKNERPVRANERWRETVIETLGRVGDERWGGVGAQNGKNTLPALPLFSPWIEAVRFPGKHSWRGGSSPCLYLFTHFVSAVTQQNTE